MGGGGGAIKILRVVKTTITEMLAEDFICKSFVSLIVNEIFAFPFYSQFYPSSIIYSTSMIQSPLRQDILSNILPSNFTVSFPFYRIIRVDWNGF